MTPRGRPGGAWDWGYLGGGRGRWVQGLLADALWSYTGAVPVEARGLGPVRMLTSHWTCAWLWAAVPGGVTAASPQHPGTEGLTTNPAATAVPRVPSLGTAFPGSGCNLTRRTLGRWSHPLPPHHPAGLLNSGLPPCWLQGASLLLGSSPTSPGV